MEKKHCKGISCCSTNCQGKADCCYKNEDCPICLKEKCINKESKESRNKRYDLFIRSGLAVGFTDDQVDFLERWIFN